ncbi:MAG: glycosyltransferase family 4 protein [Candidatus Altiarchaeota archaeon]
MRVCMFVMLLPQHVLGGMEIHSMELAKGIARKGHEVVVITNRHPEGKTEEHVDGVEIRYADEKATSKRPMGMKSLRLLEELHRERKFDVIHSQAFSAFYYVSTGLKKRLGIPLVTTLHGTPFSEVRSNMNQGWNNMLIPKIGFHLFNYQFRFKEMISESDAVIAISKELAENAPSEFKIPAEKVKMVINGVDTEDFRPSESRLKKSLGEGRVILSVSVLHRQKGVQHLINAMKDILVKAPDAVLVIVGDGPYKKDLEELASKKELRERIIFKGRVPNTELIEYYNSCDVFAIPTVRVEGLPLIELEAMSCGKPVVASNIGGIPTVIEDRVNGMLANPGDAKDLAGKILEVLCDKKLSEKLGKNARKTILEKYSRERMAENTIRVYEDVTRG